MGAVRTRGAGCGEWQGPGTQGTLMSRALLGLEVQAGVWQGPWDEG